MKNIFRTPEDYEIFLYTLPNLPALIFEIEKYIDMLEKNPTNNL